MSNPVSVGPQEVTMRTVIRAPALHWVCFACRKQFRKPPLRTSEAGGGEYQTFLCPQCKGSMVDMGRYFRPPRREDTRAWRHLWLLAEHGYRFRTEGSVAWARFVLSSTTGRLVARPLIANCACHTRTEGQRLLLAIAVRQQRTRRR